MQSPVKLVSLLRPSTRSDLLAASAASSMIFTATPFLLPAVADAYGVTLGTASLISSVQLGGFVIASWLGPRFLRPSNRLLIGIVGSAAALQAASVFAARFTTLLCLRGLSGIALGLIAWMGWQEVFGDDNRMGDLAVVGPIMGVAGAPLAAYLAATRGIDAVFIALAIIALIPLPFALSQQGMHRRSRAAIQRSQPLPAARAILICLGLMTASGSAVFVFGAAIGTGRVGLDPLVVSLAFSANAALGIIPARYRGQRPFAGGWVLVTATMAILMTAVTVGFVFWIAVALWGFAFWAGVPGIFGLLAARSAHPSERAGDAQSIMAAGRVIGPMFGALLLERGSFVILGLSAAGVMTLVAAVLLYIEHAIPPVFDPSMSDLDLNDDSLLTPSH